MIRTAWRRIPVDVIAFLAIGFVIFATHRPLVSHGMCFNDPSWYFHFGRQALAGHVPYRDYVFQVGPLPIYVDAGFQAVFGSKYMASMYAGLFIKCLRVLVMWMLVRRLAGWRPAALLAVFCAFDPIFAFAHHWSTPYAELFVSLAGLFVVLATRSTGRRELAYWALAGASLAAIMSARQSGATIAAGVMLVASTVLLVRKLLARRAYVALWSGYAAGLLVLFGLLALGGALGPAIQQMFLDAPEKKGVDGLAAILDAISGGALVADGYSWWTGLLFFLGLPIAIVAAIVGLAARDRELTTRTLALVVLPVALVIGLATRNGYLDLLTDTPRTFLSALAALALIAPDRLRGWFGLEPLQAIVLGALPLTCDWALEMSFPGRGWGDAAMLASGVLVLALATPKITDRAKLLLAGGFALAAVAHTVVALHVDVNPFAHGAAVDGKLTDSTFKSRNKIMRGLQVLESRVEGLAWLASQVPPGSTCFVYGNMPVMYDLLGCKNPTRIDTTTADFITAADANAAIDAMRADPPDFIIAQDKSWMSPPIDLDLHEDMAHYGGLNPRASFAIHVGMRSLIGQYEHVGTVADAIGPELTKQAELQYDILDATHLYRRKR